MSKEDVTEFKSSDIFSLQVSVDCQWGVGGMSVWCWWGLSDVLMGCWWSVSRQSPNTASRVSYGADCYINPRSLLEKIVTRSLEGGGGSIGSLPPSTFDTIHPIDLKFGTYNKLHLYFQLSETTWCLIGFHGNNSQINGVTGGRHLGFSNFQILFKFSLLYLRLTGKQHLAVEMHETCRIHCEVVSI